MFRNCKLAQLHIRNASDDTTYGWISMYHDNPFSGLKCLWVCYPKDTHVPSSIYEIELALSLVRFTQESPSFRAS